MFCRVLADIDSLIEFGAPSLDACCALVDYVYSRVLALGALALRVLGASTSTQSRYVNASKQVRQAVNRTLTNVCEYVYILWFA